MHRAESNRAAPHAHLVADSEARLGCLGARASSLPDPSALVRLFLSSCRPKRLVRSRRDKPPEGLRHRPQPYPGAFDLAGFEIVDGAEQLGRPGTATRARFSDIFRRALTLSRIRP